MKKVYRFCLLILVIRMQNFCVNAQTPPNWLWAVHDSLNESPIGLVNDASGNIYSAGYSFTKRSPTGKFIWSVKLSSATQAIIPTGLAIDAAGNLYLAGYFHFTALLDTITLATAGRKDIFVAKFNSAGRIQWARRAGGPGNTMPDPGYTDDAAYGIAVDPAGNSYITGVFHTVFNTTVHFDSITIYPNSGRGFVAKYNPAGKIRWVSLLGNPEGTKISVDPSGNAYVAYENNGPGLCKFNNSGSLVWNRPITKTADARVNGIKADQTGKCFLTGGFTGNLTFSTTTTLTSTTSNVSNTFLVKYDANGNLDWARQSSGSATVAENLVLNNQGQPYITGGVQGAANFGTNIQINGGSAQPDIFVVKYSETGVPLWAQTAGGSGGDYGKAISVLPNGESIVTGTYNGTCTFGATVLSVPYAYNMFIAKLAASPLSISEENSLVKNLQLYPNPAASEVSVSINNQKSSIIQIYNLAGQQVSKALFQAETRINVADFPAGMYLVKITSEGKTKTQKLIIIH